MVEPMRTTSKVSPSDPAPSGTVSPVTEDSELPSLSVIMSCLNSASTLPQTLESLAQQSYPGWWEVLIIDNGSVDDTFDVAQKYVDRFPRYSVVRDPAPGYQAGAINFGIAHTTGEAIVFVDSDDEFGTDYLLHMGRAMSTAQLVGASVDVTRLNSVELQQRRRPLQTTRIETFCNYLPAVVGAAMGARREAMEKVGGWDPTLPTQHDLDVCWRLYRAGVEPVLVPDAVLHYRYRTGVASTFQQELDYGEGEVVLYARHREFGMPRRSLARVLVAYARLVVALLTVPQRGGGARLATTGGFLLGRLRGSVRYRTLFL